MLLVCAATRLELDYFIKKYDGPEVMTFVTGIGMVETATRLTALLATTKVAIRGVIHIGIGGAYTLGPDMPQLLDLCLATKEVLGDFGICLKGDIEALDKRLVRGTESFSLASELNDKAAQQLARHNFAFHTGVFVTVQCVSATRKRGNMLADRHKGICENMEGAAVARVCRKYLLPMVELRCISNLVEDNDKTSWQIKEAASRCGQAAAKVTAGL